MRDVMAGVVAVLLLLAALRLATTLQAYRRRRQRARDSERALGRTIVAEIPAGDDLVLFSEDPARFYYGDRAIDKDLIVAVRVLINGAPIAAYVSRRHGNNTARQETASAERGDWAPGVAERGDGVPAERVREARARGVAERGDGVPAERVRGAGAPGVIEDRPDGIARDRWDVAIETVIGTTLVQCGAIRERVSQELARTVYEAVRRDLERRDTEGSERARR